MSVPTPPPDLELVTIGRVGVDLYPEQIGRPLAEVRSFAKSLGGSPINVAVAAARIGRRAAVITKVGEDGFGAYVRAALEQYGVWTGWVGTQPNLHTPIVFAEIYPPDDFPMLFYREPRAPDEELAVSDFDSEIVAVVPAFWATGQALARERSRNTTLEALARRAPGLITVLDIDHRPSLWENTDEERCLLQEAISLATVVIGNRDEAAIAVGTDDEKEAANALLDLGPKLAVVKLGAVGVYAAQRDGTAAKVDSLPVKTLCGLGAGDAFGGALVHGLLSGWDLESTLRFGNAAGAIVASRLACADAMPTEHEIIGLLADGKMKWNG